MKAISPTLSVIVCAYNEADTIKPCLSSLMEQRKDIDEIIVVDNNSTDDTVAIIKKHFPDITVVHESEQGLIPARNTAFDRATGMVMARVDADAKILPGWAHAIKQHFASHPELWAATGTVYYYDAPLRQLVATLSIFFTSTSNRLTGTATLYGCNMAVTQKAWRAVRKIASTKPRIMEDLDLALAISEKGGKIDYIRDMQIEASIRRLMNTPLLYAKYNFQWLRTYWLRDYHLRACVMAPVAFVSTIGQFGVAPILRRYNPETKRMQWRVAQGQEDRVVPE
ncbi:putative glycosyltransferase [Candidatus Saccharimonas aalborgensis]|jgi:glycosyltransferase involved in cell wall biosynthesis|uniref:Putative glycosyltransferase n=1 Tax=Candidatus Saccharimonas aalborgensis TaxID=1332188 RepID=R4PWD5_9BACT|nr:glycosyltransferase family 2 protein [Candidatus Saccharimonas aalborgensis]AGL62580.1 putative glycosyltransferase [Candidatus Saccharimonas aalborgensis]QQS68076.1 MAG: glycosyltransferase family 2 protein [Candidatus Saccharibacteria bacterium]QQS70402.1 MAG: glycosyltransferase family 2 protein [Candidatus Saccharibacteria bacterium]